MKPNMWRSELLEERMRLQSCQIDNLSRQSWTLTILAGRIVCAPLETDKIVNAGFLEESESLGVVRGDLCDSVAIIR